MVGAKKTDDAIVFEQRGAPSGASQASVQAAAQGEKKTSQITVDVSGAVLRPGVYDLPADSRIRDALIKAGGVSADADREYVAKVVNLAARLTDGAKVYIPHTGEAVAGATSMSGAASLININTASVAELDSLPGIGKVTAEKIIDNRPYGSASELAEKKVLSTSVYEKVKEKVSVY